jgi:monosaccharide-transporting ATPase
LRSCASCAARGIGIVFVTHFLDQVYAVSDRITVLRNGRLVGEYETANLSASAARRRT